jgi:DNA polymerase
MKESAASLRDIMDALRFYLELERESGMDEYLPAAPTGASRGKEEPESMEGLKKEVLRCSSCDLARARTNAVFGSGNPHAALMFVGEAPGEDEDLQGLPFVGRAGQLLTRIIEAIGLERKDVYIANILKCRPPGNRAPLPTEIAACSGYLRRQIELIMPKVICTLGKFSSHVLLKEETPITALRGRFRDYNGIKVMPTFHPAYLLRNPQDKRLVWEDMKKVKRELFGGAAG